MSHPVRRLVTLTLAGLLLIVICIVGVQPSSALAGPTDGLAAYCQGFASGLASASRKERALFIYHQGLLDTRDVAMSYAAGNESSSQFLQLLTAADNDTAPSQVELRILFPKVLGELCSFTETSQAPQIVADARDKPQKPDHDLGHICNMTY